MRLRLTTKLLLVSELALLITILVLIIPVWDAMRGQVVSNLQNTLRAIASTAALEVDGDRRQCTVAVPPTDHVSHERRASAEALARAVHS